MSTNTDNNTSVTSVNTNNTTVAVDMGSAVDPVKTTTKQGHSFLFCLCDMRRAVIMLDSICLILSIMAIIATIVIKFHGSNEEKSLVFGNYSFGATILIQCAVALCHLSAISGAMAFSYHRLLNMVIMDIFYSVICGLDKNWIGLGIYVFLLYPHVVLSYELAKGIMTKDNYLDQERQSCCSV